MTAPTTPHLQHVQLIADSVVARYGARLVLDGLSLAVGSGERVALVGENGVGKSTLLRVLAGVQPPDAGRVARHGSVGLLPQQVEASGERTVGALLAEATADVDALQKRRAELEQAVSRGADLVQPAPTLLQEYGDVLAALDRVEAWSVQSRLDAAVDGLGLADVDRGRALATLSGGQRSRLALAALLVRRPAILLLDEPTTHLDDAALVFLEREVAGWPGAVVATSHDRAFIDAVCTAVVDLDPGFAPASATGSEGSPARPTRSRGGYREHLAAKAAARRRWEAAYRDWQDERDRLSVLARGGAQRGRIGHGNRSPRDGDKFAQHFFAQRVDAAVSRRAKDAQQRLADLDRHRVPKPPALLRFSSPDAPAGRDGVLVQVRDLEVADRLRLPALDVTADSRLLVTGPNGAGKSTLLAVIAGDVTPSSGSVLRARGVRVGLLAQHTVWPDPSLNALSAFAAGRVGAVDDHVAAMLDVGVLHPRELRTPVGELSVGQQRRVALARLVASAPDVLLLDEPTDHLSLALVDELEDALAVRSGPVLVASHDRWLRRGWAGERLELAPLTRG